MRVSKVLSQGQQHQLSQPAWIQSLSPVASPAMQQAQAPPRLLRPVPHGSAPVPFVPAKQRCSAQARSTAPCSSNAAATERASRPCGAPSRRGGLVLPRSAAAGAAPVAEPPSKPAAGKDQEVGLVGL